jgi:hypothetical protein
VRAQLPQKAKHTFNELIMAGALGPINPLISCRKVERPFSLDGLFSFFLLLLSSPPLGRSMVLVKPRLLVLIAIACALLLSLYCLSDFVGFRDGSANGDDGSSPVTPNMPVKPPPKAGTAKDEERPLRNNTIVMAAKESDNTAWVSQELPE